MIAIVAIGIAVLTGCSPTQLEQRSDDPHTQAQLDYVHQHWKHYNAAYGTLPDSDCVNFTSQSLIARGWKMDDEWWFDSAEGGYPDTSQAWRSSTFFARYLEAHPERAKRLSAKHLDQLKLGDVVQFDWDDSGDQDHTGVVTRILGSGKDLEVYFAGHTLDSHFRSIHSVVTKTYPGAKVTYWSIADASGDGK